MDKYIVGRYAGLPRVHELAPGDTLARDLQFCGFGDNDGALAAQFEGNGDEIFRRGAHDDLAHLNATSEEDLVKTAVQQLVVVLDSAVRAEDKLGREAAEMSFLMTAAVCGVSSDGLKTAQFPAAIAATSGAIRSWKG